MAFLPQCLRECAPDGPNRPPLVEHIIPWVSTWQWIGSAPIP
jgi:hypothetical protein